MYTVVLPMIDDPFIYTAFAFLGVYVLARIVWRLIPVVGG